MFILTIYYIRRIYNIVAIKVFNNSIRSLIIIKKILDFYFNSKVNKKRYIN